MVDSQTCVTCGKRAPETETNYTLISAQFGWRLTRFKGEGGAITLEWRCPVCWREYKRVRAAASAPPGAAAASARPGAVAISARPGAVAISAPPASTSRSARPDGGAARSSWPPPSAPASTPAAASSPPRSPRRPPR